MALTDINMNVRQHLETAQTFASNALDWVVSSGKKFSKANVSMSAPVAAASQRLL